MSGTVQKEMCRGEADKQKQQRSSVEEDQHRESSRGEAEEEERSGTDDKRMRSHQG